MRLPNIFVVSSSRAMLLATSLCKHLEGSKQFGRAWLWFEGGGDWLGKTITQILQDSAINGDYAAVILTQDDIREKDGNIQRDLVPRDNCVFEAGLFIGALGVDFERCFLICSDKTSLPSDLHAPQRLSFGEPDLESETACDRTMQPLRDKILDKVREKRIFRRPEVAFVTKTELLELEGMLGEGSSVVTAVSLEEADSEFGQRVMRNLRNDVDYFYFYYVTPETAKLILRMIQALALADLRQRLPDHPSLEQRLKALNDPDNKGLIQSSLETVRDHFSVNFLAQEPAVSFCVHNAHVATIARCYLFHSRDKFVEWHTHARGLAKALADELMTQILSDHGETILRSTRQFHLNAPDHRKLMEGLEKGISKYFPETLVATVSEVCFGKKGSKSTTAPEGAEMLSAPSQM